MHSVDPLILESAAEACKLMYQTILPNTGLAKKVRSILKHWVNNLYLHLQEFQPIAYSHYLLHLQHTPPIESKEMISFFMNRIIKTIETPETTLEKITSMTTSFQIDKTTETNFTSELRSYLEFANLSDTVKKIKLTTRTFWKKIAVINELTTANKPNCTRKRTVSIGDTSYYDPVSVSPKDASIDKKELSEMFEDELCSRIPDTFRKNMLSLCKNEWERSLVEGAITKTTFGFKDLFSTLLDQSETSEECTEHLWEVVKRHHTWNRYQPALETEIFVQKHTFRLIEKKGLNSALQNQDFQWWMDLYFDQKRLLHSPFHSFLQFICCR